MTQDRYVALNGKYLQDGLALVERGDYPQASEKLWGAAAQAVKAVAAARRWRHSSHRDLRRNVERLYQETGDAELLRMFNTAESLHANFYEDFMSGDVVRLHAGDIQRFVEKVMPYAEHTNGV